MPATMSLYPIGVWFAVGLFTAFGWSLGGWLMGKLTALVDR